LQHLTMILHALYICLGLLLRSVRTRTARVDIPISKDGRRHIESKCELFLFFCDCCICAILFRSVGENWCVWMVREKLRCDCSWVEFGNQSFCQQRGGVAEQPHNWTAPLLSEAFEDHDSPHFQHDFSYLKQPFLVQKISSRRRKSEHTLITKCM
jgi:hypothetical protein